MGPQLEDRCDIDTDTSPTPHFDTVRAQWEELTAYRTGERVPVIDGESLSLAAVIAASRFRIVPRLDESEPVKARVRASAEFAKTFVASAAAAGQGQGASMYGVTTGFGGSGQNTRPRPQQAPKLQQVLIRGLQAGIIPPPAPSDEGATARTEEEQDLTTLGVQSLIMPQGWTKGAIAIRLNSLIRGHSGCRFEVLTALHQLLVKNITPCPPLRMSISASGDLGPLAYIAAAVTGEGKTLVWSGEGAARTRIPAPLALQKHALLPLPFHPKEGLAIVNGTAPSCSVAAAALWDAHWCFLLSQALTSLTLEALTGTLESFTPFLHDVARPHPGQIEVARNVRVALQGSVLVGRWEEGGEERLRQDRYALRTAPQWVGPQIEEALSAHHTITREINATTDNPIIDVRGSGGDANTSKSAGSSPSPSLSPTMHTHTHNAWSGNLCGGNFQGTSLTVALEKVRVGLQHVGRIAYAQLVELGQPSMSRGLAPDLAAHEPSFDYGQKALDIAASGYLAELSFLSNTISNHVQPAEMHNQSVNSLALVGARYTAEAVQLVQMILASHLLCLCQAVDLRALYARFFSRVPSVVREALKACVGAGLPIPEEDALVQMLEAQVRVGFGQTSTLDTPERFRALVRPLVGDVCVFLAGKGGAGADDGFDAGRFHGVLAEGLGGVYVEARERYLGLGGDGPRVDGTAIPDAPAAATPGSAAPLLGRTRHLYEWVRRDLGVGMRAGIDVDTEETDAVVSRVYAGIVRGEVNAVLVRVFGGGQ